MIVMDFVPDSAYKIHPDHETASNIRRATRNAELRLRDDFPQRSAELLAIAWFQWRDKLAEFGVHIGVERGRGTASGGGQRHLNGAPIARHCRPAGQAAALR